MSPYVIVGIIIGGIFFEFALAILVGSCIRFGRGEGQRPPIERPKR